MENIIEPIDKKLILSELTPEKFVRKTNFGDNEIYIFKHFDSPNLLREIGRLRELTFRNAGGGTGLACDIDEYDTAEKPYSQLIVWDPRKQEILGGYRFITGNEAPTDADGNPILATSQLFYYSDEFKKNYLPYIIELGRSFVVPENQAIGDGRRSLYTLDNLWDGLGTLVVDYPEARYFFGKVTMYRHYNQEARNFLLYFMNLYFGGNESLMHLLNPLDLHFNLEQLKAAFKGNDYKEDYRTLSREVRARGERIPPLINSYMSLSSTLKVFGTSLNPYFGDVEETGIMVTIADIYKEKSERHVASYRTEKNSNRAISHK